ncbi:hypothetical protein [Streptomyces sp. NBC_00443]|uniref:hypothetical protein n=1 Tax=Streptomyces sp. NBC_00443 TaxID=2975743 RepID=UPI002E21A855
MPEPPPQAPGTTTPAGDLVGGRIAPSANSTKAILDQARRPSAVGRRHRPTTGL